jgi:uncharacterized protein YcgI (DUF1989 family)
MPSTLVEEVVIPRAMGRAFPVLKGQTFRIIAHEGKQVGDLTLLNLHDKRETLSIPITASTNGRSMFFAEKAYSCPPYFNVMATVTHDDGKGLHWLHGRCTRWMYEAKYGQADHRNCHDNLVEALAPHGVAPHEVPFDTYNVFMVAEFDAEGHYRFKPPIINAGDYMDFRAEMDLLVALSACPGEDEINDWNPKALKVQIFS